MNHHLTLEKISSNNNKTDSNGLLLFVCLAHTTVFIDWIFSAQVCLYSRSKNQRWIHLIQDCKQYFTSNISLVVIFKSKFDRNTRHSYTTCSAIDSRCNVVFVNIISWTIDYIVDKIERTIHEANLLLSFAYDDNIKVNVEEYVTIVDWNWQDRFEHWISSLESFAFISFHIEKQLSCSTGQWTMF
jgi:hypothetical protein